jgi:hypothetical protein
LATTTNVVLSGEQTIDGYMTSATRVLVRVNTALPQNGIYRTGAGAWIREPDMNTSAEFNGAAVTVLIGATLSGKQYQQLAVNPVVETDPIIWQAIGGTASPIPPATPVTPGITKLYPTTGPNTDGAIHQLGVTTALNLKGNHLWTITTKTGSYTLAAAELTALSTGTSLVMEGNGTGDLTVPPNATVAFAVGDNMAVRGFLNVIAGAGVTITGTNGTLTITTGRTVILEQKTANNWILHNGGNQVTTWSTVEAGIVEESTQVEAENIASGAAVNSTGGMSQGRTASEVGLFYMLRKMITLAWTWSIGPIISDATADTGAYFNSSKKLVSGTVVQFLDWLGINPIRENPAVSSGTLTLNLNNKYRKKFVVTTVQTASFTIAFTNETTSEEWELYIPITGAITVTVPASILAGYDQKIAGRWNDSSNIFSLGGGTATWYKLTFCRIDASNIEMRVSPDYLI